MDKVDKIISIVKNLREEGGMTTGSSGPIAGLSQKSPAEGPMAGTTPKLGKVRRRNTYATGGTGSRRNWLDYLKSINQSTNGNV